MKAWSVSRPLAMTWFGDEEARNQHAARTDELLDKSEERSLEESFARQVRCEHALAHGVEERCDDAADDGLEQLFLGLEVEIGEALAHFGARGDVFEPGRGVAVGRELLEGRGHDLLWARVLALPLLPPCSRLALKRTLGHGLASSAVIPWP
jgi:hypothetical protein